METSRPTSPRRGRSPPRNGTCPDTHTRPACTTAGRYAATAAGASGSAKPSSASLSSGDSTSGLRALEQRDRSGNVTRLIHLDELPAFVSPVVQDLLQSMRDERNGHV